MKKYLKVAVGFLVTFAVILAKAEVSSASSIFLYQPKLPKQD
ncbi:MAG: cyclic lactone autoinducer peptide [Bacillaceae bacterium]|nr:cyclic lactone autoinducer peptide [Bacillaceae bacterium]